MQIFQKYLNQNVLSILVYKGGFSFLAYDGTKIVETGQVEIGNDLARMGENFIAEFSKHKISKFPTKCVELSFVSDSFTFIPQEDFSTDTAHSVLQAVVPIDPFSSIRFNPIPVQNCVVCFPYNEEIEFFFENKYPFVTIIHNSKRILDKFPKELDYTIQLNFHQHFFEILAVGDSFECYNYKTFDSKWDVVYELKHLMMLNEGKPYIVQLRGNSIPNGLENTLSEELELSVKTIPDTENYSLIS